MSLVPHEFTTENGPFKAGVGRIEDEYLSTGPQRPFDQITGRRVMNILRRRVLASLEQIIVKVCECSSSRPRPELATATLDQLIHAGVVSSEIGPGGDLYYALSSTSEERLTGRRKELDPVMSDWCTFRHDTGQLLNLLETSADKMDVVRVGDALIAEKDGMSTGVLSFNTREWLTVAEPTLWDFCDWCDEEGLLPVIVARKIDPFCLSVLRGAGVRSIESKSQYFHPALMERLLPVQNRDLGGIKDLICPRTLDPRLENWFSFSVWQSFKRSLKTFRESYRTLNGHIERLTSATSVEERVQLSAAVEEYLAGRRPDFLSNRLLGTSPWHIGETRESESRCLYKRVIGSRGAGVSFAPSSSQPANSLESGSRTPSPLPNRSQSRSTQR